MSAYEPGQRVEVPTRDFKAPGMPRIWAAGVVEAVTVVDEERGLTDVRVTLDEGGVHMARVGPRGGGKAIRPQVIR